MTPINWPSGRHRGTVLIDRTVHVAGPPSVVGGFVLPGEGTTFAPGTNGACRLDHVGAADPQGAAGPA